MAEKTIAIADKPTLDEVKALLENSGYGLEAIKEAIIGGGGSDSVIKSIQRGTAKRSDNISDISIIINSINPDKSFVLLNGLSSYSGGYNFPPRIKKLSETSLDLIDPYSSNGMEFSWQVIEFY